MKSGRHPLADADSGKLGLLETLLVVAGFVIGASIYVLPGELYGLAGPAMALSVFLAAIPAALSCAVAAQVGAAFPTDAANINLARHVLSPFWAAAMGWAFVGCFVAAQPLIAFGFADYLGSLFSPLADHRRAAAISVIAFFALMNLSGAKLAARIQTLMVLILLGILALFVAIAAPKVSLGHFSPLAPLGLSGVFYATVPAFFAFLGFSLIVEISGEIRSPQRTIPQALAVAFVLITTVYVLVTLCITGVLPGTELSSSSSVLAGATARVAPQWAVLVVSISALLATATTINAAILLASREIAGYVRLVVDPADSQTEIGPLWRGVAVTGVGVAGILCCTVPEVIGSYAIVTVLAFLVAKSIVCFGVMKLPGYFGDRYEKLAFCIKRPRLRAICWALLIFTVIFMLMSAAGNLPAVAALGAYLTVGIAIFLSGRMYLGRRGAAKA